MITRRPTPDRSRHNLARRVGAGVIAGLATITVAGCTKSQLADQTAPAAPDTASTVTVTKGDIVSVVTLDGVVQAAPTLVVNAPSAGPVSLDPRLQPGDPVSPDGAAMFTSGGQAVRAGAAGVFVGWLVTNGETVAANVPVANIKSSGFGIAAATPPDLAYRIFSQKLTATAQLRGGPADFSCTVNRPDQVPALPDPNANNGNSGSAGDGPSIMCVIPPDIVAVDGLRAFVALRSAAVTGVLTLPITAVAGSAQSGAVWLVNAQNKAALQHVTLGVSNGSLVEITGGLKLGDKVTTVAPDEGS